MKVNKNKYTIYRALKPSMHILFNKASRIYLKDYLQKGKHDYSAIKDFTIKLYSPTYDSLSLSLALYVQNDPIIYQDLDLYLQTNPPIYRNLLKGYCKISYHLYDDLLQFKLRQKTKKDNAYSKHITAVLNEYNNELHQKLNKVRLKYSAHLLKPNNKTSPKQDSKINQLINPAQQVAYILANPNKKIAILMQFLMPELIKTVRHDPKHLEIKIDNSNLNILEHLVTNNSLETLFNNKVYIAHSLIHLKH